MERLIANMAVDFVSNAEWPLGSQLVDRRATYMQVRQEQEGKVSGLGGNFTVILAVPMHLASAAIAGATASLSKERAGDFTRASVRGLQGWDSLS